MSAEEPGSWTIQTIKTWSGIWSRKNCSGSGGARILVCGFSGHRDTISATDPCSSARVTSLQSKKKARCQADTGLGRRAPWRPEASTRRNVGGAFGGLPFPAPNRNVNPSRSLPFAITLVLQPRHGNHSSPESVCRPTTRRPDAGKTREPFGRFTGFLAVCARVVFEGRIAGLRIKIGRAHV